MIPVEFSYFRTIFGKSGQGSCLSGLPGKCRELLSYLSVHFFEDKGQQFVTTPLHPVCIPAGRTVIWEFDQKMDQANVHEQFSNSSTNALCNVLKYLSLNNIIRNIYLTYYAGEIEIADKSMYNNNDAFLSDHLLIARINSGNRSSRDWFFNDPIPEKFLTADLKPDHDPSGLTGGQFGRSSSPPILRMVDC